MASDELLFAQRQQRIFEQSKAFSDDEDDYAARRREEDDEEAERRRLREEEKKREQEKQRRIDAIMEEKLKKNPVRPEDQALLDQGDARQAHFQASLQRLQAQGKGAAQRRAYRQAVEAQNDSDEEFSIGDSEGSAAVLQWSDLSEVEEDPLPGRPDGQEARAGYLLAQLATEKPAAKVPRRSGGRVPKEDPQEIAALLKGMAEYLDEDQEAEEAEEADPKRRKVDAAKSSDQAPSERAKECPEHVREYPERVREALDDFWELDPEAQVHGSYAVGLWDEASDLDLLSTKDLVDLRNPEVFKLLEYLATAEPPRLRLLHRATKLELDVVKASRDPLASQKDEFLRSQLRVSAASALARRLKRFHRRFANQLRREEGYPNFFLLLLMGFFYLAHGSPASRTEGESEEQWEEKLFTGWVTFMENSAFQRMTFDLRDPAKGTSDAGGTKDHWSIVEPVSGRTVAWLDPAKVSVFLEALRQAKGLSSLGLGL